MCSLGREGKSCAVPLNGAAAAFCLLLLSKMLSCCCSCFFLPPAAVKAVELRLLLSAAAAFCCCQDVLISQIAAAIKCLAFRFLLAPDSLEGKRAVLGH